MRDALDAVEELKKIEEKKVRLFDAFSTKFHDAAEFWVGMASKKRVFVILLENLLKLFLCYDVKFGYKKYEIKLIENIAH